MIKSRVSVLWLLLLVLLIPVAGRAQAPAAQQFATADWFSRPLGTGVTWYFYHFDNLFAGRQTISYVEADLNLPGVSIELPYRRNSLARTTTMVSGLANAAAGANATFFGGSPLNHNTYLRVNGQEIPPTAQFGNFGFQGGLVFNRNTNVHRISGRPRNTGNAQADWRTNANEYTDAIVAGPLLMRNGAITRAQYENIGSHCTARHPRTMVGMKPNNKLVLVVADGRHSGNAVGLTCEDMAQVMAALGCTDALSLDGGGSSILYGRGEPFNGILSYPSDNGGFDKDPSDERNVANAIAIIAPTTTPRPYDARLQSVSASTTLVQGETKTVTVRLTNIGFQTWKDGRVSFTTSRPANTPSPLYTAGVWPDEQTAWKIPAGTTVPPGQSINISFPIKGPATAGPASVKQFFQLTLDDTSRFGPADSEIQLNVAVTPSADNILVESRAGGKNVSWYSETGQMADVNVAPTAAGVTPGLGMRYGSTYRTVAGEKAAHWRPSFPGRGFYRIYAAWGNASSRRSPITYKVTHRGGTETILVDQAATANTWVPIGNRAFEFNAGASQHGLTMSNEDINISGNMYAGPVWFEYVGTSNVEGWELY